MKPVTKTPIMISGIFFAFCLMMLAVPAPSAKASTLEGAEQWKNGLLDGIEQFFVDTGLPETRRKLKEEHGLEIRPYFKTRYELTSNVFLAPDDNSDHTDNIWSFIPGVNILYDVDEDNRLGVSYEAAFHYFTQFYEQNEQDQRFLAFADLKPTDQTYVHVSEAIDQEGARAGASNFKPVNVRDNTVEVIGGYIADETFTHELRYRNFYRAFSNESVERYNYYENRYDYRLFYNHTDDMQFFGGVRIAWIDFPKDSSRDTFYYEFPVGVKTLLPYGVKAIAEVGIHRRNVEDSNRNDIWHIVTDISLSKEFNEGRTSVQGGFSRRDYESSFSTATTYDEKLWYGSVHHLVTDNLRARLQTYVGNRDFEERVFTGSRIIIGGVTFVTPANQVKRDDTIFGITLGCDYRMRNWLVWHLDYRYGRRDSNISALDYTENALTLGSTISL